MIRHALSAAAVAVAATMTPAASAQVLDNAGTEFLMAFLKNIVGLLPGQTHNVQVHLAADQVTDVTVTWPANAPLFSVTETVVPGVITIVSLPDISPTSPGQPDAAQEWISNMVQDNAVRATADHEFVAYMVNVRSFSSDAAMALPVDTANTEYILAGRDSFSSPEEFAVTAPFDDTEVSIIPTVDLEGGRLAGVPFTVTLMAGQSYYASSIPSVIPGGGTGGITGTIIEATRPVLVSNGSRCAFVPDYPVSYCDHLFEVAQPVQTWGHEVVVADLPLQDVTQTDIQGSVYRVIGSVDGTSVSLDGAPLGMVDRGGFIDTGVITGDHIFSADQPIFVVQFMTGTDALFGDPVLPDRRGDPAMSNMIPFEQYLNAYTFSTVGGDQFDDDYLTIIARDSDVGVLELDGSVVPALDFAPVAGTGFSVARLPIAEGTHTTSSPEPHGITVEGYNTDDSYLYPGGARFEFINPVGDANPPICSSIVDGAPPVVFGLSEDSRPSEDVDDDGVLDPGEDLNGNLQIDEDTGIYFIALAPGATNLQLDVDPFTPGDPIVNWTVSLVDTSIGGAGAVITTDGAGNTCEVTIALEVLDFCGDVDGDDDVDFDDYMIIVIAYGSADGDSAFVPEADLDGNGVITITDLRAWLTCYYEYLSLIN